MVFCFCGLSFNRYSLGTIPVLLICLVGWIHSASWMSGLIPPLEHVHQVGHNECCCSVMPGYRWEGGLIMCSGWKLEYVVMLYIVYVSIVWFYCDIKEVGLFCRFIDTKVDDRIKVVKVLMEFVKKFFFMNPDGENCNESQINKGVRVRKYYSRSAVKILTYWRGMCVLFNEHLIRKMFHQNPPDWLFYFFAMID